jgi:Periplasmic protein TonB, links inner and outer membranes
MSWKQTIYPNLDDKKLVIYAQGKVLLDWFLWCLAVTQKVFGVAPFVESAQIAWNWNNTKHQDCNLPDGCFVPIWWTGGYKNYGHVAVAKRTGNRIQIWSSPYTRKPFFDYFEGELNVTIDTISRIYSVSYAGWTETMNTTRIIEWVNPPQLKSNEEIAAEIWQKKWGDGEERKRRLAAAGYSWDAIQSLVDKGVGKPVEKPAETSQEPPKQPEQPVEPPKPEPVPEAPKENPQEKERQMEENKTENINKDEQKAEEKEETMKPTLTDEQINKINEEYMKLANASTEAITEAGSGFEFSNKTKIIAYLIGDFLLLGSAITPQVVLAIMSLNDKNMTAFGTALASILATLGSQILLIFKLLKKKK